LTKRRVILRNTRGLDNSYKHRRSDGNVLNKTKITYSQSTLCRLLIDWKQQLFLKCCKLMGSIWSVLRELKSGLDAFGQKYIQIPFLHLK